LPIAVFIEIFEANDATITITSRRGILVPPLAAIGPSIEVVGTADLVNFRIQRIGPAQRKTLAGVHRVTLAVSSGFSFTFTDGYDCVTPVLGGVDSITTGARNGEGLVCGINFEDVVPIEIPNAQVHASCAELDLNCAVIEIQKGKASIGTDVDR
jgi:hypothetical protein